MHIWIIKEKGKKKEFGKHKILRGVKWKTLVPEPTIQHPKILFYPVMVTDCTCVVMWTGSQKTP
jgi:hypothetical protein